MTNDQRDQLLMDMGLAILALLKATSQLVPDPAIQKTFMQVYDKLNETMDDINDVQKPQKHSKNPLHFLY